MAEIDSDVRSHGTTVIQVGQDRRGRWLVQDRTGGIEGVFLNRQSALGFAQAECDLHHFPIEVVESFLVARLML